MPAGYDSSGGLFLFGGSWLVVVLALVTGDWDSLVSSSRAQPSIFNALWESACMR